MSKYIAVLLLTTGALLTACGATPSAASKTIECKDATCADTFTVRVQKVEGVISQRQVFPQFIKCLGLTPKQVSPSAKAKYQESIGTLSFDGQVKDIHAPMLMAITNVASELCLNLVDAEKQLATRKFFGGFKFTGGVASTQTFNMNATITALSTECWGRPASQAEIDAIINNLTPNNDNNAAVFACTVVLSSPQAIRF